MNDIRPMYESVPDSDAILAQFNRLIQELLRGSLQRNTFRPWEVALLLDIEGCGLRDAAGGKLYDGTSARSSGTWKRAAMPP